MEVAGAVCATRPGRQPRTCRVTRAGGRGHPAVGTREPRARTSDVAVSLLDCDEAMELVPGSRARGDGRERVASRFGVIAPRPKCRGDHPHNVLYLLMRFRGGTFREAARAG